VYPFSLEPGAKWLLRGGPCAPFLRNQEGPIEGTVYPFPLKPGAKWFLREGVHGLYSAKGSVYIFPKKPFSHWFRRKDIHAHQGRGFRRKVDSAPLRIFFLERGGPPRFIVSVTCCRCCMIRNWSTIPRRERRASPPVSSRISGTSPSHRIVLRGARTSHHTYRNCIRISAFLGSTAW
jgi:hypothetical protein